VQLPGAALRIKAPEPTYAGTREHRDHSTDHPTRRNEKVQPSSRATGGVDDACRLVIACPVGSEERHFDASDYYECLRAFRRVIEHEGFGVLCQGARPNVCPSPMARDMGELRHTLGEPAFTLVRTIDPVEDIASVGTVEEEVEFMRRHWELFKRRYKSQGRCSNR